MNEKFRAKQARQNQDIGGNFGKKKNVKKKVKKSPTDQPLFGMCSHVEQQTSLLEVNVPLFGVKQRAILPCVPVFAAIFV